MSGGRGSGPAADGAPARRDEMRRQWRVFVATGFGTLMSAPDASVVNTELPVMSIFLTNLPIGGVALAASAVTLPQEPLRPRRRCPQ